MLILIENRQDYIINLLFQDINLRYGCVVFFIYLATFFYNLIYKIFGHFRNWDLLYIFRIYMRLCRTLL